MSKKVLFILKKKDFPYSDYGNDCSEGDKFCGSMQTGLLNSASFVNDMLQENDIESDVIVVVDNNDIDREVTKYQPDVVIIEALWVVPEKFDILQKLHPSVKWIVRLHSAAPFIANEGIAMKWIFAYVAHSNVSVSSNDRRLFRELKFLVQHKYKLSENELNSKVLYQPNYYPPVFVPKAFNRSQDYIDIGCFGAVRPLKNQLAQALAAIEFANKLGKRLNFHINGNRVEMKGSPVLHNLIGLFKHFECEGHKLVMHDWCNHYDFLSLVRTMDIGMQVSYTETFNIVAADFVSQGVPIVTSEEIIWTFGLFNAHPNSTKSMVKALQRVYRFPTLDVLLNKRGLQKYDTKSKVIWLSQLT